VNLNGHDLVVIEFCTFVIVFSLYLNLCALFKTAMGNERANSYWEAELPTNYDRVGIENFIRAKYVSLYLEPEWFLKKIKYNSLCTV
jgi:hypothetical protein